MIGSMSFSTVMTFSYPFSDYNGREYLPSSAYAVCTQFVQHEWAMFANTVFWLDGNREYHKTKTKTKTKFAQNEFGGLCQCGDGWTMNKNQDFGDNRVNCAGSRSGENLLGNHFQPLEKNS